GQGMRNPMFPLAIRQDRLAPGGSIVWKKTYSRRTASERCFKRAKVDYQIERRRSKSKRARVWHAHLIDAWVRRAQKAFPDLLSEIFGRPLAA
ncbi:MAG: hypothetical protein AB1497_12580, partial [Bacillota bacterium]